MNETSVDFLAFGVAEIREDFSGCPSGSFGQEGQGFGFRWRDVAVAVLRHKPWESGFRSLAVISCNALLLKF